MKKNMQDHSLNSTDNKSSSLLKNKLVILGIAVYIMFILLTTVTYIAESHMRSVQDDMDDQYTYSLQFPRDGEQSHYNVERVNTSKNGEITLTYTTDSNTLQVETTNIKELTIDCESIYQDESMNVFKLDPATDDDYYNDYFMERDMFTVNAVTDHVLELRFKHAPVPYEVYVDADEWWKSETGYTYADDEIVVQNVPKGATVVEIYFKTRNPPVAAFTVTGPNTYTEDQKIFGYKNKPITFDASDSMHGNSEGEITKYEWYFGDDSHGLGKTAAHKFTQLGTYNITLTVTNNYGLTDEHSMSITIVLFTNDKDSDLMDDTWELEHGFDPTDPTDAGLDTDADGLINLLEYNYMTDPTIADTDSDGYSDGAEIAAGSDPLDSTEIPIDKDKTDDGTQSWMLFAGLGVIAAILIMFTVYAIYLRNSKEQEAELEKSAKKRMSGTAKPRRKLRLKSQTTLSSIQAEQTFIASTIPKELSKKKKTKPQKQEKPDKDELDEMRDQV